MSKARNFRRRARDDGDNDGDNNNNKHPNQPSSSSSNPTKRPRKLLSFVDDGEGNASPSSSKPTADFDHIPKPSSSKRRLANSQFAPSLPASTRTSSSSLPSNIQPKAGTYTKEALLELQSNTRSLPTSHPPISSKPEDEPVSDTATEEESGRESKELNSDEKVWEEGQFRKGIGKTVQGGFDESGYRGSQARASNLIVVSVKEQAQMAKRALRENLTKLKESHGRTMLSIAKADEDLSASLSNITALEKSMSAADGKYEFMQKLRKFVEFFEDKEECEELMQKLDEEPAAANLEIRSDDEKVIQVEAAVNSAMSIYEEQGRSAEAIAAAKIALQAVSAAIRKEMNIFLKK